MKVEFDGGNLLIIFKKQELQKINFDDIDEIESYFRTILLKLKDNFNIDIKGFYNIYVYVDPEEGMILKLEKEDIDYYDSFHQIEMRIIKEEVDFLYEVDDILNLPYKYLDIYVYKDKFYVKKKGKKLIYDIYEFGKVVFEDTKKIIENGKKMTI